MNKQGQLSPAAVRGLVGGVLGTGAGYWVGGEVTPKAFGYADNPYAVNMSRFTDALLYGSLGAAAGSGQLGKVLKNPSRAAALVGGIGGAELAPVAMDIATKSRRAVNSAAEAARDFKPTPGVFEEVSKIVSTPEAKGVGLGTASAALAAILSGLLRSRGENELDSSRSSMVAGDFARYAIPAAVLGGLAGHLGAVKSAPADQPAERPEPRRRPLPYRPVMTQPPRPMRRYPQDMYPRRENQPG